MYILNECFRSKRDQRDVSAKRVEIENYINHAQRRIKNNNRPGMYACSAPPRSNPQVTENSPFPNSAKHSSLPTTLNPAQARLQLRQEPSPLLVRDGALLQAGDAHAIQAVLHPPQAHDVAYLDSHDGIVGAPGPRPQAVELLALEGAQERLGPHAGFDHQGRSDEREREGTLDVRIARRGVDDE